MTTILLTFAVIPFGPDFYVFDSNIGILFFLGNSSLGVYSIVLGGWASNNKYSLIGAMRASAQMLTYEVFMGLSLMGVVMMADSFSFHAIVEAQRKRMVCNTAVFWLYCILYCRNSRDTQVTF